MTKTKWSVLLLMAGLTAVLYYGWIGPSMAEKPAAKPARQVEVITGEVKSHDVAQSLNLVGSLTAQQSVDLAFQVFAPVAKVLVQANAQVQPNQVLVQLDDSKARAALAEAQSVLNEEQRKLKEFQRIISRGAITQTELDAQRASVDVAEARLTAAQAALNDHQLRAPFAGTLGLIDVNLGDMTAVGEAVLSLDNLNTMQLDLLVPERHLSQVSTGMTITAHARAWPEHSFVGKVVAIDSRVNQDTLNVRVRVNFDNADQRLKPGMFMSAQMNFPSQTAPMIPVQGIEYSGTDRFVYVVQADGKVARTQVILGARINNDVLIESGLAVGDRIVVQGLVNMRDGIAVRDLSSPATEEAN